MRQYTLSDHFLVKTDKLLRMLCGQALPHQKARENPAENIEETELNAKEKNHVAGLMRVNYTGEVCAQALYQGQAFTARNQEIKQKLEQAGLEEEDHLLWCQSRLEDLNSHASYLNPLWYGGSFLLGVTAGIIGDKWNLGFLEETERQVVKHLDHHLTQLPEQDAKTRAILNQMRAEEAHHAEVANEAGAESLPQWIKTLMKWSSKIMTTTAYRI